MEFTAGEKPNLLFSSESHLLSFICLNIFGCHIDTASWFESVVSDQDYLSKLVAKN